MSLLSGLPLLVLCSAISAQEPPPPPPTPQNEMQQQTQQHPVVQKRLDVLLRGITLTPEQRTQVDSVIARNNAEITRLAGAGDMAHRRDSTHQDDNGNGNGDALSPQLKSALEKQEKEIRDTLTDEQKQTWDRNAEQLKAHKKYDEN